jgi:hypothetical protein
LVTIQGYSARCQAPGYARVQSCIDKKVSAPHAHPPACGRGGALCAISPPVQRRAGRGGWFCRMRMHQGAPRPRGHERPRCAHEAPLARGWREASARTSAGAAAPVVLSARRLSVGRGGGRLPDNACSHPVRPETSPARLEICATNPKPGREAPTKRLRVTMHPAILKRVARCSDPELRDRALSLPVMTSLRAALAQAAVEVGDRNRTDTESGRVDAASRRAGLRSRYGPMGRRRPGGDARFTLRLKCGAQR